MIIAIANNKGGVGKSTLAVHLAAWLHRRGKSVILADCDTQRSSSEWIREVEPGLRTVTMRDADEILDELPPLATEADFVIADGPGSNTETSRALLLRASAALIPCKASMLEVRALTKVTDLVRQAQDIRGGMPPVIIVLSTVGKNYRLTNDMKDAALALSLLVVSTPITLRQIYTDARGQGSVVWDMKARSRDAAKELDRLFAEIIPNVLLNKAVAEKEGAA